MLQVKNISKKFNNIKVLNNINLSFPNKGLFFVVGESGSGKTTLINIIARLDKEDTGEVWFNNINLSKSKDKIISAYRHSIVGMVFQNYNLIQNLTVDDNFKLVNGLNKNRYNLFLEYLKIFKVIDLLKAYPYEMSGGEQQRVALARTLAFNYKIILADEPTGSLDRENGNLVMDSLIKESKNSLVILITHDLSLTKIKHSTIINLSNTTLSNANKYERFVESSYLVKKKINLINVMKNSFKSFMLRKTNYISLVITISFILGFLIINLSLYNGFTEYINVQSMVKLDSNYFSIYSINQGEVDELNQEEFDFDFEHIIKKDLNTLVNNYFNQLFKFPNNDYFEVKITNLTDGIYANNLFQEINNKDSIILAGNLLVPFFEDDKLSYERVNFDFVEINVKEVQENKIYNVPKLYISEQEFFKIFKNVKLPLISNKLNLKTLSFEEYHRFYSNYLNIKGLAYFFNDYNDRKEVSEQLLKREDFSTFFGLNKKETYFQLKLNDEMFESTFKDLIESLRLIVTLLVATLMFTLVNVGSLILNYSFRKRIFEYSIQKVYGASNTELFLSITAELSIIMIISIFLTVGFILLFKMIINSALGGEFDFVPLNIISFSIMISLIILVLFLGSIETLRKSTKLNLIEALRND